MGDPLKGKLNPTECRVQRTARRDKKAFLTEQCKEVEEDNRMGKTRDLFKNIGDTKGRFHARMGAIKDRNGRELIEAERFKNRWQGYTDVLSRSVMSNSL